MYDPDFNFDALPQSELNWSHLFYRILGHEPGQNFVNWRALDWHRLHERCLAQTLDSHDLSMLRLRGDEDDDG
jgi:hypothetical protein